MDNVAAVLEILMEVLTKGQQKQLQQYSPFVLTSAQERQFTW